MNRKQPAAARQASATRRSARGWLLAHNSVRPAVDTRHGVNGFRRFWVLARAGEGVEAVQVRLAAGPRAALPGLAEKAE